MTKNNLSRTSNEEKQSVRKLKWWETIFKAAEIKKSNFQTSSKDNKNLYRTSKNQNKILKAHKWQKKIFRGAQMT